MSFSQLITVLQARWRLGLSIWLGTLVLVLCVSYALLLLAPKYTATAAVVVDGKSVDPIAGAIQGGMAPGYMATEVDIAQSERVILRAIQAMHLTENAELRQTWLESTMGRGSFEAWLAKVILKKYTVLPSRESNAMTLSYTAGDPAFAADMTNALMRAFIATTLELRVEPAKQYNTFFDERSHQLRAALEAAQNKLSAYQRESGLLATDERFDVENARLAELSSLLLTTQTAAAEAGGRQAEAGTSPRQMQEVVNSQLVATLSTDLSRAQARLQELRTRIGDNHPSVIEAKSSVAEITQRLAEATNAASGSVAVTSNVARGRLEQVKLALEQQRAKVLQLKAKRDEASVLQRDVENAQRAYDAVLARISQTDMESQNRQTNVSVLQNATQPPFPTSPRLLLNGAIAAVMGVLLAVGAILWREMSDRRMRTEDDVMLGLNQPLLIVLPRAAVAGRAGVSRLAKIKTRVLSGAPRTIAN